jgi:predicted DNA-binding transcriptional regulator YafY
MRVFVGQNASSLVLSSFGLSDPKVAELHAAFFDQRHADIDYVDQHGTTRTRTIEARFLYFNMPIWYVLAWGQMGQAPRSFRIDRITRTRALAKSFRLRQPLLADAEHDAKTF